MKGKSLRIFEVERCNQKIRGRVGKTFYFMGKLVVICQDGALKITDYDFVDGVNS